MTSHRRFAKPDDGFCVYYEVPVGREKSAELAGLYKIADGWAAGEPAALAAASGAGFSTAKRKKTVRVDFDLSL